MKVRTYHAGRGQRAVFIDGSQYLYLLVKVRTSLLFPGAKLGPMSQYLYLLVKVRTMAAGTSSHKIIL